MGSVGTASGSQTRSPAAASEVPAPSLSSARNTTGCVGRIRFQEGSADAQDTFKLPRKSSLVVYLEKQLKVVCLRFFLMLLGPGRQVD